MADSPRLVFRVHTVQRMFHWLVSETDVREVLETGEIIEDRADEPPYPVRLILGWVEGRPLHAVAAFDEEGDTIVVITVYEPDPERWINGFRSRKSQ
ncbi:MAG TPA: DUF4258 domain-containing protein [Phycisphaerales bacterium]|nr:DUF4258 domain-containing protein [Phycisphaerales bacterium]